MSPGMPDSRVYWLGGSAVASLVKKTICFAIEATKHPSLVAPPLSFNSLDPILWDPSPQLSCKWHDSRFIAGKSVCTYKIELPISRGFTLPPVYHMPSPFSRVAPPFSRLPHPYALVTRDRQEPRQALRENCFSELIPPDPCQQERRKDYTNEKPHGRQKGFFRSKEKPETAHDVARKLGSVLDPAIGDFHLRVCCIVPRFRRGD